MSQPQPEGTFAAFAPQALAEPLVSAPLAMLVAAAQEPSPQAAQARVSPPPPRVLAVHQPQATAPPNRRVQVAIRQGCEPGQPVRFTTPDGQCMQVAVQERMEPGAVVTVEYAPVQPAGQAAVVAQTCPAAPLPQLELSRDVADRRAMECSWLAYGIGWACCCCCGWLPCALALWAGAAAAYFAKPPAERQQRLHQRVPARAAAITFCVMLVLAVFAGIGWGLLLMGAEYCSHRPDQCRGWLDGGHQLRRHHHPQAWQRPWLAPVEFIGPRSSAAPWPPLGKHARNGPRGRSTAPPRTMDGGAVPLVVVPEPPVDGAGLPAVVPAAPETARPLPTGPMKRPADGNGKAEPKAPQAAILM